MRNFLLLILIIMHKFAFSQNNFPVLSLYNSQQNLHVNECRELKPLRFEVTYNFTWTGDVYYYFYLYRNNQIIATKIKFISCNICCNPNICEELICTCELPGAVFDSIQPISGIYKVKMKAIKEKIFGLYSSTLYDDFSNSVTFTRFDDNSECKCEQNPETINVDCFQLNIIHNGGSFGFINIPPQDVKLRARQILISNCDIAPNGYNVTFVAGNTVSLKPGFSSGNNFRAYLDNCDDGIIVQRIVKDEVQDNTSTYHPSEMLRTNIREKQKNTNNIAIYPNPTNGLFTIETPDITENTNLKIYNTHGQLMLQQQINSNQTQIDLSLFGKGLYLLYLKTDEGEINIKKIIVQ
ncbi:MAG: hypothetical protein KatS3mg035_1599 [Bacteroidia bacterium]|nr:MAG: hypothetical protein KatS3mg035_1599 [Bacteroidia bacterium]